MTQDKPDKKCKVCSFSPGKMIPVSDVRYPVCSGCGEPMLVETSKTKPDKKMRSIRHGGTDDIRCFCRQCEWLDFASNSPARARYHCKKTKHTVDVYREHWTELTFNWKKK